MGSHEVYLRSALSKYRHPDHTKREVLGIFQSFSDLRPNVMNYVFNDGQKKELLCLEGTIPVTYKGKTYNIPICIYLMNTHPYNPPFIYVKPTPTMQLKQGKHVDATGRVYLPYLHEWKHPSSDLLGLIQILTIVFGEEMPVFSKKQTAPVTTSHPPYPMTQQPAGSMAPYPTGGVRMPMPNFPTSSTPSYPPGSQYPPSQPYPGYPPSYPTQQPQPPYPGGFQHPYAAPYAAQTQQPYSASTGVFLEQTVSTLRSVQYRHELPPRDLVVDETTTGSHEAYYMRSALSKHRHPDQTKREVLGILQSFSDLRPNVMIYVLNDGQEKELICLEGTIPVTYKGKTYNIPICIYLMDTHPYDPPIIHVKPTPIMQVKQGRHVDAAGLVNLPYLHEWKHPSSDLLGLIHILAIVFGEEPPLLYKQPAPATTTV